MGAGSLETHAPRLCLGPRALEKEAQQPALGQWSLEAFAERLGLDSGALVEMKPRFPVDGLSRYSAIPESSSGVALNFLRTGTFTRTTPRIIH